ncbi:MAG: sulfate transporter, partial [Deltaproteobacteria bacterium]
AESLSPGSIAAAGLATGAVVLVLGLTGLVETIDRLVPRPVVRGIQLGVGLKLLVKGIDLIRQTQPLALDGWLTAAAGAGVVLLASRRPRFPSALVLFAAGIAVMAAVRPELLGHLPAGWNGLHLVIPSAAEWETGIVRGAVPQLPLTLLNSVIAVCALSEDLYPGRGAGTRKMAASVGLMNVLGCWLGAMPMCHGAGGLAGQHRFGARTGGAVVMLGIAKMAVGVAFGASAGLLLAAYPLSILGVLLAFAGIELALPARECREREPFFVAVLTAGGCLGFNTAVGVLLGLGAAALMRARTSAGKPVV